MLGVALLFNVLEGISRLMLGVALLFNVFGRNKQIDVGCRFVI